MVIICSHCVVVVIETNNKRTKDNNDGDNDKKEERTLKNHDKPSFCHRRRGKKKKIFYFFSWGGLKNFPPFKIFTCVQGEGIRRGKDTTNTIRWATARHFKSTLTMNFTTNKKVRKTYGGK